MNDQSNLEIAIIGMSGRFPQARNLEQFWKNLRDGVESISFFSEEELGSAGVDPAVRSDPDYVKAGTVLEDADFFDASFFGFSPLEAGVMDPQHRLFLECAYEALEDAGYDTQRYQGPVGVFGGAGENTYLANLRDNHEVIASLGDFQTFIANGKDFLTTRVSYKLNLRGPSVDVQTACSTSLVAVHMACQSLLSGECDIALAGGVAVTFPQITGYVYQEGGILSPDGHCRAFDAKARGVVGGSGVGVVVLKRLPEALAEGDCIHAVIKGSAINNDGSSKIGFTAPNITAQCSVIRSAQIAAGVDAETITYIESHGTATELGDPIEVAALTEAFRASTQKTGFCAIGSLKTNIGHADAAAGVAGLIKTVLALEHKFIPASLHYEQPNPKIDFANSPFYVNTRLKEWKAGRTPRRAGVSSFGMGGTNAHVVLEEAPEPEASSGSRPWQLILLSAKTPTALETASTHLVQHVREHPELRLADVAYTLQTGRPALGCRRMLLCRSLEDLADTLEAGDSTRVLSSYVEPRHRPVVFMFPGQGSQYVNMGRELYDSESAFREEVDHCCELLVPHLGFDLRKTLFPESGQEEESAQRLQQTLVTQPALFVIEYALARLWMRWGIKPEALIGHSIGEYVAACLAGVFSLKDALLLVAARGRLMQQMPPGAMFIVPQPEQEARSLQGQSLSLAAVNGPSLCVLSGPSEAVDELEKHLATKGVEGRRLVTSHAFHSAMMDPMLRQFSDLFKAITAKAPKIPFVSNLTGTWITAGEATHPEYWSKHLRQTVRFAAGVETLLKEPDRVFLEVGPGHTLSTLVRLQAGKASAPIIVSSMRSAQEIQPDEASLLTSVSQLWLAGVEVDWSGFYAAEKRRRVPLPTYPFERQRYWIEGVKASRSREADLGVQGKRADIAEWFYIPSWKRSRPLKLIHGETQRERWLVFLDECGLGLGIAEKLQQLSQEVIIIRTGTQYAASSDGHYTINPCRREDYEALLKELHGKEMLPQRIVHLWSVTPETPTQPAAQSFQQNQNKGFESLLCLAQAMNTQGITDEVRIDVVSNQLHEVIGGEVLCPEKATLLGPCKVISQEHPNLICRSIDVVLPGPGIPTQDGLVNLLVAEFHLRDSDPVIAYRGRHRWVQMFEPVRVQETPVAEARLREGGVYLITGGLGHIGLVLAEFLARSFHARLILIGRSSFPERPHWPSWLQSHEMHDETSRKIQILQRLEDLGAEVMVVTADVGDREQMEAGLAKGRARFGKINGVIHAAGSTREEGFRFIAETTGADCKLHFQPKVHGLLVLEEVLRNQELDFCLLTSSLSAILGGLGFVAYSAANLFMDAYVHWHNQTGGVPWISVNWDGWNFGKPEDVSAPESTVAAFALTPQEGVEAFQRILSLDASAQVVVSTGDLKSRFDQWMRPESFEHREESKAAKPSSLFARPNLRSDYLAPRNEVEQTIADLWQELLGLEQVGVRDNFFELGGHSLLGTQLMSRLRKNFNVDLNVRNLYDAPTIAAMAESISQRKVEQERSERLELLQEIERLAEDEVDAELTRRKRTVSGADPK